MWKYETRIQYIIQQWNGFNNERSHDTSMLSIDIKNEYIGNNFQSIRDLNKLFLIIFYIYTNNMYIFSKLQFFHCESWEELLRKLYY